MTKVQRLRNETYNEACDLLQKYGQCAIIRPTGFGKTGILTRFIKSGKYKKILYLYPAEVVKNTVLDFYYSNKNKKDTIDNVIFMTYMKLTNLSETDIEALQGIDLIICDECHRLGATETMEGMKDLLALEPTPHILGATATPERMDMIDEIALFFDDHVTSRYSLHDAIQDKIIKKPYYCFCAFGESNPKRLAEIKKDAMLQTETLDINGRQYANELLNARMLEIAKLSKMEYVIEETLKETNTDTSYQKYIVFFSDFAHMRKAKKNVKTWFTNVFPNHKINELIISSETEEYKNNVNKLDDLIYKENTIDLVYSCEMLNMGYHVSDLTGIMMYRGTYSSIIYMQQLGRALSTGDTEAKIVFDIVDNIHRKSVYAILGENYINSQYMTNEEVKEYIELVNKTHDKDINGNPIRLTAEETNRFIELSKLFKKKTDSELGKINNNTLSQEDLIVTKYAATYREFILSQQAPTAVPLSPFCRLKNVSVNAVLDEMGVA